MKKNPQIPLEDRGKMDPDLAAVLNQVGAEQYARATAHLFAKGGKFNKKPKPRYALT